MKKVSFAILAVLLLIVLGTVLKLFVIGEPVDGNTVICDVTSDGHQINISVTSPDSAVAFCDNAKLHQDGNTLYITLRKVLASPLNSDGEWFLYLEKSLLTEVYLGGKLIWSE